MRKPIPGLLLTSWIPYRKRSAVRVYEFDPVYLLLLQVNSEGFSGWLWSAKSPISHAMTGVIALQNFFGRALVHCRVNFAT